MLLVPRLNLRAMEPIGCNAHGAVSNAIPRPNIDVANKRVCEVPTDLM